MPDNTVTPKHEGPTSVLVAELETGGYAVSLNGMWLPGSSDSPSDGLIRAAMAMTLPGTSLSDLIFQAADTRDTLFRAAMTDPNLDTDIRLSCGRAVGMIAKLAARLMAEVATPPAPPKSATDLRAIIRQWLDADDATHWGEFEKALDELVEAHS